MAETVSTQQLFRTRGYESVRTIVEQIHRDANMYLGFVTYLFWPKVRNMFRNCDKSN